MTDVTPPDQHNDPAPTQKSSQHLLASGVVLAQRFEIIKLLGQGGQASVYEAFDQVLEEKCALKILLTDTQLDADSIDQLRNEVILARQLQHPSIVRVHEFYTDSDFTFFTMSLISGVTLTEKLDSTPQADHCLTWFKDLVSALNACHESGILHGDIKPANIVITDDDQLKLVDFGIGSTATGAITHHFSEGYTAPELAQSHTPTAASDRYALGKVLEQMMTAIDERSWKASALNRRELQKLATALQAAVPEQRPSLALCQDKLKPKTNSLKFITTGLVALSIVVAAGLWWWVPASTPPHSVSAEQTISTIAIHSDNDKVNSMADLIHLTLQAEPHIYSIEPATIQQLVSRLGIQPNQTERERSRLAQLTAAQYLLTLSQKSIGSTPQLHALLTVYPGEQVLLSETYAIADDTAQGIAAEVSQNVRSYLLTGKNITSTATTELELQLLEKLQAVRAENNQTALKQQLQALVDTEEVSSYFKLQARAELALIDEQYDAAAQIFDRLLKRYPKRADIFAQRAQVASWQGELEQARQFYQQALALDSQQPYWWFELARLKIIQGEIESALQQELTQALIIFRRRENDAGQGLILNAFGVGHLRLAQYQQAFDYFSQALDYRSADDHTDDRITTLGNLATTASILGDFAAADAALIEAKRLAEAQNAPLAVAHIENERGLLNEEQGLYRQALVHYKRALDLRLRDGDGYIQSQSINNVAFINFLLGDYSLAEVYWRQALQIVTELNETATLHSIQISLAHLLSAQGQFRQAEQLLVEVITADDLSPEANMTAHIQLSRLNFAQSRAATAVTNVVEAIRVAKQIDDTRGLIESVLWQTEMALHLHQYETVKKHLSELQRQADSFNREQALTYQWLQEMLQFKQQLKVDFHALADTILSQNWSQLLELKLLSELVLYGDFAAQHPIWERLEQIDNETVYAPHLVFLAAQKTPAAHQELQSKLKRFPSYWRNFELYRLLSTDESEQKAHNALQQLLENMNEEQRQAYQQFAGR